MQQIMLPLLWLSVVLAVAGHTGVCGEPNDSCMKLGKKEGVQAYCLTRKDRITCTGSFSKAKQHCPEHKHCGCCVPKKETVNQCEGNRGKNSLLWKKVASSATTIITTINEGNYNVTDAMEINSENLEKTMKELTDANSRTEIELNYLKDNQEISMKNLADTNSKLEFLITHLNAMEIKNEKTMKMLTDANSKTEIELNDLKVNQEIAMKNCIDANSKLDFILTHLDQATPAPLTCPTMTCAPCPTTDQATPAPTAYPTTTSEPSPTTDLLEEVNFHTVGGTAEATSNFASKIHSPLYAFGLKDPNQDLSWHTAVNTKLPQSIWYEFPEALRVVKYSFQCRPSQPPYGPTRYEFWGSNDCSNSEARVTLFEDTSGTPFTEENIPKVGYVENPFSYRCYGFTIIATAANTYAGMQNIRFYYHKD